ncbi:hypothetical protein, partial [Klebsiella pneumoniae]
ESYKESTNEGESVGKGRVRTQGAISRESRNGVDVSAKSTVTSETGGSTTRKATDTTWRVLPSANLNQTFVAKFSQAGYDVIEA